MTIKTFHTGFTLPTLLIISTVLMIMGAAVLQGTVSVKNALDAQFYNQIAREAAEAGIRYGQACLSRNVSWNVELRPSLTCMGTQNGAAPDVVLDNELYRTTFRVQPVDRRADGSTLVVARGITELRRSGGETTAYRTFTETLGESATTTSMNVLPEMLTTNQTVGTDGATYMLGYDNTTYSMGSNGNGQLGDGTSTDRSLPTDFKLPDGVFAKKVVTGNVNTFVIGSDGLVYGAGDNANGQLGNGTTNNTSASNPTVFQIPASVYALDVVTGGAGAGRNTFVLGSNGRVYGAGTNQYNQLHSTGSPAGCDNQNTCHTRIVLPAPDGQRVKKMATTYGANNNTMLVVIAENGAVYGRGRNNQTQLGGSSTSDTGNRVNFTQMALPTGALGVDIQTAYYNTYILASNGQVYGFGQAGNGQLGNVATPNSRYNTAQRFALPGSLSALKLSAGTTSNAAETDNNALNSVWVLASDHQVYGAGQNIHGQLGDTTTVDKNTPVRFALPANITAQDVSSMYFTTCVLTNTKQVYCSGSNKYGQLGLGNTTNQSTPRLFPLPSGVLAQSVTVGYGTVHVIGSDGNVYSAGRNDAGQLGDGTTTDRSTPIVTIRPSKPLERKIKAVSMGFMWTSVLLNDGTIWGTGENNRGQLGAGFTSNTQADPVLFQLPQGYARDVRTGAYATRALTSDVQLYGAGFNADGQIGFPNITNRLTPHRFSLAGDLTVRDYVISTSAGESVTFAIASDNQVYGAGRNGQGQLGNGNTSLQTVPSATNRFRLPGGTTARQAFFGDGGLSNSTYVRGANNVLYAAGLNDSGQLGIGNTASPQTCGTSCPVVQMPSGVTATDVTIGAGGRAAYFTGSNGRPYASGQNNWGQLADGSTTGRSSPVAMNLPSGLSAVKMTPTTGALAHSIYILASDGQLYGAGRNSHGQLGRGTENNSTNTTLQPVQIPSGLSVNDFWIGQEAVFILASDGQVYGAGRNDSGQLGTGDTVNKLTATQRFQLPAGVRAVTLATQSSVSTGSGRFTGVLGSDGRLYVAGDNSVGQLGQTVGGNVLTPRPYELPQPPVNPGIIF